MTSVTPPNIWTYEECNSVNTDSVNMKEYKLVGQFYTDTNLLCQIYNIKPHPIFKEPVVQPNADLDNPENTAGSFEDQHRRTKEPTSITISKYRLDFNSMKVLFKVLEGCQHI